MIFAFLNEQFGVWIIQNGSSHVVPFLNLEAIENYWYLLVILFGFGIVKESFKLLEGKWTMRLVIFTAIANLITMIAVLSVIISPNFWNPNFMQQLVQTNVIVEGSEAFHWVRTIWEQATVWVMIGLIFTLIWDATHGLIKARSH